eukprot:Amastigsp_a1807_159.p2 type:complete len:105 gc:universal Amastigsp_a1807_159:1254-940(-)
MYPSLYSLRKRSDHLQPRAPSRMLTVASNAMRTQGESSQWDRVTVEGMEPMAQTNGARERRLTLFLPLSEAAHARPRPRESTRSARALCCTRQLRCASCAAQFA